MKPRPKDRYSMKVRPLHTMPLQQVGKINCFTFDFLSLRLSGKCTRFAKLRDQIKIQTVPYLGEKRTSKVITVCNELCRIVSRQLPESCAKGWARPGAGFTQFIAHKHTPLNALSLGVGEKSVLLNIMYVNSFSQCTVLFGF